MNKLEINKIETEVTQASNAWKNSFNARNAKGCAAAYKPDAIMKVGNVGEFKGTEEIEQFWSGFIGQGANNVSYFDTTIKVLDENTAILTSNWKMNVGEGIITLEKWEKQSSGAWLLAEDAFEMTKQYTT